MVFPHLMSTYHFSSLQTLPASSGNPCVWISMKVPPLKHGYIPPANHEVPLFESWLLQDEDVFSELSLLVSHGLQAIQVGILHLNFDAKCEAACLLPASAPSCGAFQVFSGLCPRKHGSALVDWHLQIRNVDEVYPKTIALIILNHTGRSTVPCDQECQTS